MKTALKVIGGIFVALIVIGLFADSPEGSTSSTTTVTRQAKQTVSVTARQLVDECAENEAAFELAYEGKAVLVTGRVDSIGSGFSGAYVTLGKPFRSFQATDLTKQEAASLRKGSTITVYCESVMEIIGSPAGSDCTIR